jgi:hypothetical protein
MGSIERFSHGAGAIFFIERALEVAAAGSHNVLMLSPSGADKTLLARRTGHPAAYDHRRGPGCNAHLIGNRPTAAGCAAGAGQTLLHPVAHHLVCRAGGRRQLDAPGRNLAGEPRGALPGRAARVWYACPVGHAPTDRG